MNTQIKELENVCKSCKVASVITRIIEVIILVAAVVSLIGAIVIAANGKTIDAGLAKAMADGGNSSIELTPNVEASFEVSEDEDGDMDFDMDDGFRGIDAGDSDDGFDLSGCISVLGFDFGYNFEDELEAGQYAKVFTIVCLLAFVGCLVGFAVVFFLNRIFNTLQISETPFTQEVVTNLKKSFIALVILLFITSGLVVAFMLGVVLYGIYNIFQYGVSLQTQADETL